MYLQGYKSQSIAMPQPFKHKQAPSTSNLRSKMIAEQRARRIRSVNVLPEEQRQNGQLVIDRRNSRVNSPHRLFRPWQQPRTNIPDVSHVVSSAIIRKDVPSGIKASGGEEYKGSLCCVNERRHHCTDTCTNEIRLECQRSTVSPIKTRQTARSEIKMYK